ncbi:hypothetical protein CPB86DRAFT_72144, partial [Serendipita vermifera]
MDLTRSRFFSIFGYGNSSSSSSPGNIEGDFKRLDISAPDDGEEKPIIIGVMGLTGAGKSTIVNLLSGSDFTIGRRLQACTNNVQLTEKFTFEGRSVVLIDTPGFDDTNRSEQEILIDITNFLTMTYRAGVLLSGILYLHRITDNRAGGVAVRNFSMFRKLCGAETLKNVVIATTMWQKEEREVALEREEELRNDPKFFKHAIGSGASLRRHDGGLQSAQALLRELVKNSPSALRVQRQVVDEKKDLDQTDAGIELAQEQQRIVEQYEKKMKELERTMRDSNRAERELLEKERKDMENHQRRVKEEQENMARDFRAQQERMRQMEEEQRRLLQQA